MIELATDADLTRRLAARAASRGQPSRARCRRCRKGMPEGKRADAKYCSETCKRAYRWERRNELVREIRLAVRAAKVAERCPCGAALDTRPRPGPVPACCVRCYNRDAQRRRRAGE